MRVSTSRRQASGSSPLSFAEPLKRKTCAIKASRFPGEDPFHVPTQGLHQDGDDGRKQQVLNYAVEIHQPYSYARPGVEVKRVPLCEL